MLKFLAATGLVLICASPALAQTATASSPSSPGGGASASQQAPSGGAVSGNATGGGQSKIGAPTEVEKQEQAKSSKDTEICKGC